MNTIQTRRFIKMIRSQIIRDLSVAKPYREGLRIKDKVGIEKPYIQLKEYLGFFAEPKGLRIIVATLDENQYWKSLEREGGEIKNILGAIYSKVSKRR